MSDAHIIQVPKAVFGLKIAQIVVAVLILGLSAFVEWWFANSGSGFAIFCCVWTFIINAYYLASTTVAKAAYNWIALLVLECLAVVFWLCVWAVLAADYVIYKSLDICGFDGCISVTDLNGVDSTAAAAAGTWQATIVFGVVQFILFCVTLVFFSLAVHRHRIAGKPMNAPGSFGTSNAWGAAEKNEMNNMQPSQGQAYQPSPEYVPPPQGQQNQAPYGGASSPVSAYSQHGNVQQAQYQGYGGNPY